MTDATERFFDDAAGLCDVVYADHEFYVDRAREADGPVLEAACGTGRIYLEHLRAGVDADGFDVSRGMLAELERKAAGLDPTVWQADVTEVTPPREYALVIVPFRWFLHNLTVADQVAALERFRAALRPDGELVLDDFAPDFDGQWLVHAVGPDAAVEDAHEPELDVHPDPPELVVNEFELALVSKRAFDLLSRVAGYDSWTVYGGFDPDPFESPDEEMVWVARP